MKLVEGAKQAYKWFSMQAMTLAGGIVTAWALVPPELQAMMPPKILAAVTTTVLVAGLVGRLVKQGDAADPTDPS